MEGKSLANILKDKDFLAAINGGAASTILKALENADERGVFFQTLSTEQLSGKTYLETGEIPIETTENAMEEDAAFSKKMRSLRRKNAPRHFLTGDVLNEATRPKMQLAGDRFVKDSFPIMVRAVDEMYSTKTKFSPERFYKAFFDDILAHQSDWRHFFSVENNQYLWAEKVVPLVGNLSMIYRQRKAYADCDQVMAVYKEILDCYQEMIARRRAARLSDDNELVNCRGLVYKYHRVVVNLAADTLRFSASLMDSYRAIFQFEIDTRFVPTEEDDGFLWIFTDMMRRPGTSAALRATTDQQLSAAVQCLFESFRALAVSPAYQKMNTYPGVYLAICAGCSNTEPFLNTYKLCGRCKAVKYCGKECQVAHHKQHKKTCKAA